MRVPVLIKVRYSAWPLILALSALGFLLLALIALWIMMRRARAYTVRIGQSDHQIRIKPRERRTLADAFGNRAEIVGRLFGAPSVRPIDAAQA